MPRLGRLACVFALSVVACAPRGARETRPEHGTSCEGEPPAGIGPLLHPRKTMVLGDLTGTREVPELVGRIACHAATAGVPVRLVLELPRSERQRVAAFVRSRGEHDDRLALLRGPFWLASTQVSASTATLALLERVRAWRAAGAPIEVVSASEGIPANEGDAFTLALVDPRREPIDADVALRVVAGGGTRWSCTDAGMCGTTAVAGEGDGFEPRVRWTDDATGWDGVFYVGVVSASRPVIEPSRDFDSARGM